METRIQRPKFAVSNENVHTGFGKINAVKNVKETKRAVLGDLGGNNLHVGLSNVNLTKSKLPVLKTSHLKSKSSTIGKPKASTLKENQLPTVNQTKPLNLKTLIDRTKTLKIHKEKKRDVRPDGVEDIDKEDGNNPFLLSCYTNDIYEYLRYLERKHPIKEDYLKGHSEITPRMRSVVIDWLVEVRQEYSLLPETLHLAVGIFDKFLQNNPKVDKKRMQLIGTTALYLASKYEEISVPYAEDFVYISASAFKERDLFQMEQDMFRSVGFDLSRPISLVFLRRFSKAAFANSQQHTFAKYFLELALVEYKLCHVNPSLTAAASLYLALFITSEVKCIDESLWTKTLEYYSGYKIEDFKSVLQLLAKIAYNAKKSSYQAVVQKYSSSKFFSVSENQHLYSERMKNLASD